MTIIIIHHKLGLRRPVVALSNSVFKGLPSHLCPFGLYFRTIFWHPVVVRFCYML